MKPGVLRHSFWIAPVLVGLIVQPVRADMVEVRAVQLNLTPDGIEIILEMVDGKVPQVFTSSYDQTFLADITDTVLHLPEGSEFHSDNPVEGITSVTVKSVDSNHVQLTVKGAVEVPTVEVKPSERGLIFSVILPSKTAVVPPDTPLEQESEIPPVIEPQIDAEPTDEGNKDDIEQVIIGTPEIFPQTSTPVYVIPQEEIQKQGANSAAEVLRGLPGFAINDVGFGADIHTGTYYRGHSINQSVFLLNGRTIGTNISTYHGATDLNSIPVDAIERVELSSGTSSTLYGSEAFGGVVNIITKQGQEVPQLNGLVEYGSFDQSNYRVSYGGSSGNFNFHLGYEEYEASNRYRIPVGAANRDSEGRLFNGDTATSNYFGSVTLELNSRNTLSLDAYKISSRRGLLYFGFPLQRDRLNHDALNVGLSWKTELGSSDNSILRTTLSYNQDYFNTYGPTQQIFYRTGTLNSEAITARVEHQWSTSANNQLTWGFDWQNSSLNGEVLSTNPQLINLNETENRERTQIALFALDTWRISKTLQAELGLRQNFNSEFDSYLNPSIGVRWNVNRTLAMRGSWASVQRNPGLDQLYVFDTVHNWLPNPDLEPETGSSWTAGVDIEFSENLIGQLTYFGSHLDNRLGIRNGKWENIGLVNTHGLEVALRWNITPEFSTFFNYTYTDAQIETGLDKGLQLGLIPYSVGQLGIGYSSAGWEVNLLASYYSGSRRALFNNPGEINTDFSPSWLNLDLSGRIPITRNLGLMVYLENLADVSYEKANRIYQPGLTFRIGLQSNF